jgi:hypothetical protein
MRSTTTFSILFWIYAKRTKNNLAPLYAGITVGGKSFTLALKGESIQSFGTPKSNGYGERPKLRGTLISTWTRYIPNYFNATKS